MTNSHRPAARGERGAALITALLMTTLLLSAGGALIMTASMTATTAADSSAEMQAYYAAEAGLEAALAVARHNVAPKAAGTQADFRTIVCGTAANCENTGGDFSQWLNAADRTLGNNLSYTLSVRDASLPAGAALPPAPYAPTTLLVNAVGRGPKGARKQLQLVIRPTANIEAPGAVTLRGAPGGGGMTFDLGTSNGRTYLTDDPTKPVFVTTNATDTTQVTNWIAGDDKSKTEFGNPPTGNTAAGTARLPSFLASPAAAEALIQDLKAVDTPDDNITIVEGDASVKNGSGLMVVTGTLDLGGNSEFRGILLVLGEGKVTWGGQGAVYGAMFIANYDRDDLTKPFGAPSLNFNGAGKSTIQYSTTDVQNVMNLLGVRAGGVVEN